MNDAIDFPTRLDARALPPRERNPAIFLAFQSLEPGQAVLLINDYDPRGMRYHLEEEHGPVVGWAYLERGPTQWRVAISRLHDPRT